MDYKDIILIKQMIANGVISQEIAEKYILELKESEDERMKKIISDILLIDSDDIREILDSNDVLMQDIDDWLEKQGNPDINPSEFDLRLNKLLKQFETLPKEELANSLSFYLNVVQNDGTYKQKLSDKVEPKFKVGDWVVDHDGKIAIIYDLQKTSYVGHYTDGTDFVCKYSNEHLLHLWTIQDAKDGDVLVHNGCTFIFMGIKNGIVQAIEENLLDDTNPVCFGEPDKDGDYHPATKEQRDTLIKAMTDAGYTFDFEKKELKKIEEEIEIPFGAKDSELQEVTYYIPKGFHAEINDDKVVIKKGEKSTAWSEEDEKKINYLIALLQNSTMHNSALRTTNEGIEKWLKSIKPQDTWRPSDEQMNALSNALSLAKNCGEESAFDLRTLYEQLKKLS